MGEIVNCYNFTQLFSRAWTQAMSPSNIMSGFRCTGICPFNRFAIKVPGGEMSSDDEGVVDLGEKKRDLNTFRFSVQLLSVRSVNHLPQHFQAFPLQRKKIHVFSCVGRMAMTSDTMTGLRSTTLTHPKVVVWISHRSQATH